MANSSAVSAPAKKGEEIDPAPAAGAPWQEASASRDDAGPTAGQDDFAGTPIALVAPPL